MASNLGPVKETLCSICGTVTAHSLWCEDCLAPYRKKGEEWERVEEAKRVVIKKRREQLGW